MRKTTFTLLCRKAFGDAIDTEYLWKQRRLPLEIEDITQYNDWIAIIHADGNGLGQIVQKIGTDKDKFRNFSRALDKATKLAAQRAFQEVVTEDLSIDKTIPMRPIVLSGDDHTVICRADIAIPYTEKFLEYFEEETERKLGDMLVKNKIFTNKDNNDKLTACAGIAFVKSSFPFHFGYRLAESLCERAKKDTKALFKADDGNLPASCLMFHKVQDSFVVDFRDIAERELTPQRGITLEYGPYYLSTDSPILKGNRWSIATLLEMAAKLNGEEGNAVKSGLRNWLTLLHENTGVAAQKLGRMMEMAPKMKEFIATIAVDSEDSDVRKTMKKDPDGNEYDVTIYPVYDMLAIHTINNQTTRNNQTTQCTSDIK